jgi:hypothetical protein
MKVLASLLLLGVVICGCSGMVKRAASNTLFQSGKEYTYKYRASVTAGSADYVSFASTYNITGQIRIAAKGNNLNVQLAELQFGVYNGEYAMDRKPHVVHQAYQQLNPLQEPFQISLENGKVKGLVLSGDAPEWAKNIQRGIANALQLSLSDVNINTPNSLNVQEQTIVGDCDTDYEIIPKEGKNGVVVAQVRKFRSHSKCQNAPVQNRIPQVSYHYCPDDNSRDVYNSSGFGVYDLELTGDNLVAKKIMAASSVSYQIFSAKGHQQYTFASTEFTFESVKDGAGVGSPANPQNFDNIKYVFEQTIDENEDLTKPQPFYFHHKAALDADSQTKASEALENSINQLIESVRTTGVYDDLKEFHRVSPFSIIPHVNALDYEHLKQFLEKVKNDADVLKKKVFLDSLVITGTGPAALVIRDYVKESDNFFTAGRLLASLVSYIRNPTEKLVKEFETLLKPTTTTRSEKLYGRVIDFAFASLVQRACKKTGCQQSGLLDKYVKYYSDRYDAATHFEEQTAAVAALSNIGIGGASAKLLTIVQDKQVDRTVRVQALPALKYLAAKQPQVLKQVLLAIFFDRSEHCELRAAAAKYAVVYAFTPEIVNQIVIYMWTEKSPLVKNYVYTLLKGVAGTTRNCIQTKASYARTALSFFPPWTPNPKYSANYLSDYYDRDYNFGQMTDYVVHKVGTTFLPTVVYMNVNGAIAGYGNSYLTAFIRMEGLGKAVLDKIMTMKTQITKFDDIKSLYEKIGVVERKGTPLKLEFGLMLRGRIVTYHAADKDTLKEIPKIVRFVTERAQKSYDTDLLHTTMLGGMMTERPNEFGTPVTARSAVTGLLSVHAKVDRTKTGDMMNQESDLRFQAHMFGVSGLDNHMPAFGSVFSVTAFRTTRVRLPRHVHLSVDLKQIQQQQYSVNIASDVPKEDDPAIAMFHASAVTTITADASVRYKDNKVASLLQTSCTTCKPLAVISKGDKHRDSRQIGFLYKYLTGVQGGLKYFDCEKVHNRLYVYKQLRKVFGPDNKNDGGRILSKIRLGLSYLRESLFLSPITQTCGLKGYFYQDKTQKTIFEKIEGQIRVKYTPEPDNKIGTKVTAKSSLKFIYGGAEPKTRNFDVNANFQLTGLYKRDLRVRLAVKDEITNKNGIVCVDVSTAMSKPNDWFAYDGQNEPTQERTINIVYGAQSKDGKDTSCPDKATSPNIKYVRKSHRSQHQIEEAASDMWPYKQCREQRQSGKYPGSLYPATEACAWAAFEQTKLRESNITIDYKVDPEARNRWKRPGAVIATILMPYWVPEDTVIDNHAEHHGHSEGNLISGRIAIDLDLSSENPEADIHFHGSQGQHEHFHGIDLDALPVRLLNPVSTRFQPLQVAALKLGLYAYCDVTTGAVQTFDNNTYFADLSECPTLISGDCGPTPRYAVYAHKIAADKLAVTIQLGGHKVELNNLNNAVVDGQEVTITDALYSANEKKIFQLFKLDENNVFLWSKTLGVYVRYTGHYTTVTAGSRYRGTNCGVCGNFNDIKSDDFNGPDNQCANMGGQDMMKAYILRDGNCAGVGSTCPVSA